MVDDIQKNYQNVIERIDSCARKCSRSADSIKLVVVTKGQPAEKINQVIKAGAKILGENYPEETHDKIADIKDKVDWHMIGHLQSRKIKFVVEDFAMIHSIDRDEIAEKLNFGLSASGKKIPALLEVNLSGETSKSGYSAWDENNWNQIIDHFIEMKRFENLEFCGFMTMPPITDNPETSRPLFTKCRRLLELYQKKSHDEGFNNLSMGTSLDYEVAIEEGATFIRIGQSIMGERNYR